MSQYYTDFEDYALSTPLDSHDWTRIRDDGSDWEIVDGDQGHEVEYQDGSFSDTIVWDAPGQSSTVEVVARLWNDSGNGTNLVIRDQGTSDQNLYAARAQSATDDLLIRLLDDGDLTTLSDGNVTFNPEDFWIRFQADGTSLSARLWEGGETEPESWDVQATDSTFSSGDVGFMHNFTSGAVREYGVGTDGDPAPTEPVSAGVEDPGSTTPTSVDPLTAQTDATGDDAGTATPFTVTPLTAQTHAVANDAGSLTSATISPTEGIGIEPMAWESLADAPAGPWDSGMAGLDGNVHIMGGGDPDDSFAASDIHQVYDPDADSYSTATVLPDVVRYFDAGSDGDAIYGVGAEDIGNPSDELLKYESGPDSWSVETTFSTARVRCAVSAGDGYVAVVCGDDGDGEVDVIDIYDIDAETLDTTAYPGGQCHAPGAAIYDGALYVAGGYDQDGGRDGLGEFHRYDIEGDTWTELDDNIPTVLHGRKVAMEGTGGHIWMSEYSGAQVWRYSIYFNEFDRLDDHPEDVTSHSGTYEGDYYYLFNPVFGEDYTLNRLEQVVPAAPTDLEAVHHE